MYIPHQNHPFIHSKRISTHNIPQYALNLYSSIDPFYGAPTIIAVLADRDVATPVEDGSRVIGNLMDAAHAVGVDSCWIHRAKEEFDSSEGKELLKKWGVEDRYIGIGRCILCYRDCEYPEAAP